MLENRRKMAIIVTLLEKEFKSIVNKHLQGVGLIRC